ncbi:MAG: fibronectin type III domain-containing protein [Thermoplasmata archaeon]
MIKFKYILIIIFLLTTFLFSNDERGIVASQTNVHEPIYINGNTGFVFENGVVGGNGTFDNPYIIEGWTITASDDWGIKICNTDTHFIIRKCKVKSQNTCIELINVRYGKIIDAELTSSRYSISITQGKNISLENMSFAKGVNVVHTYELFLSNISFMMCGIDFENLFSPLEIPTFFNVTVNGRELLIISNKMNITMENRWIGQLVFVNCTNISIRRCIGYETTRAIQMFMCSEIFFQENIFYKNIFAGIHLSLCKSVSIDSNIFIENGDGCKVIGSRDVKLERNWFIGNGFGTTFVEETSNLSITHSIFYNNTYGAILFVRMSYAIVTNVSIWDNLFIFNNFNWSTYQYEGRQALSYGKPPPCFPWNTTTKGNFWSDWITPDNNNDGFVDEPYPIEMLEGDINYSAQAYDYLPLSKPSFVSIIHTPVMKIVTRRVNISATMVHSGENISKVICYIRFSNDSEFIPVNMTPISSGEWIKHYSCIIDIPPGKPVLQYYIYGEDWTGKNATTIVFEVNLRPPPPQNLSVKTNNGNIYLQWNCALSNHEPPLLSFNVYRGLTPENKSLLASADANTTSYIDSNVTPGITYYYHVTAVNAIGESEPSNTVSATPGSVASPPQNLTTEAKERSIVLAWNLPVDAGAPPLTGYNIYRGLSMENKTLIATVDANTTTFVDTNITPGITYYYHVTAVNAIGESEPSNTVCVTVPLAKLTAKILVAKSNLRSGEEIETRVVVADAETGEPVKNATVSLSTQLPGKFESLAGQTDGNGTFTTKFITGNVNASIFGKLVANISAEHYENATTSILLGILPGEMKISVEIDKTAVKVGENFTVVVSVKDENGDCVEDASVEILVGQDGAVAGEYQKFTNAEGRAVFTFSALKEGNLVFQVVAKKEGYAEARSGVGVWIKAVPEQGIDFGIPFALLLIVLLIVGIWEERKGGQKISS